MGRDIPNLIHYCWFGGNELPKVAQKCIKSWEIYCPDFELVRWDESNFDITSMPYVREAYDAQMWAFVSDVARLRALEAFGGIYLDTDMEVVGPLDVLLGRGPVLGFEDPGGVAVGFLAAPPSASFVQDLLNEYEGSHFLLGDGTYNKTTIVERATRLLTRKGLVLNGELQVVDGVTVLPVDYLYAKDHITRKLHVTPNTVAIHHYDGSWLSDDERFARRLREFLPSWLPAGLAERVNKLVTVGRFDGARGIAELLRSFVLKRIG